MNILDDNESILLNVKNKGQSKKAMHAHLFLITIFDLAKCIFGMNMKNQVIFYDEFDLKDRQKFYFTHKHAIGNNA